MDELTRLTSRVGLAAAMMLIAGLLASGCGDESVRTSGTARAPTAKEEADEIAGDIQETEANIKDA